MKYRLRELRSAKGISQQVIADLLHVSQQSITNYESGKNEPDIQALCELADYFETSVDYLIGHTDIQGKIEPRNPYDLNAQESDLIDRFRLLSKDQRKAIGVLIDTFLKKS